MRGGAIVAMVVIGAVVAAVLTLVAAFGDWLPLQASEERVGIDFVFWMTTWICVAIFAVVAALILYSVVKFRASPDDDSDGDALILYSVVKFRASPDDDSDGAPIHGHTGVEIVWTAIPFVLVTAISVASGIVLARNDDAGPDPLRVEVTAQQFAWSFRYANGKTSPVLNLPLRRSAELHLQANDVIHSFWVAEFGQKQDAVPGTDTKVVVTPTKLGRYDVICTELCGLGHALMRSRAVVMEPAEFARWLADEGEQGAAAGDESP